MQYFVEHQLKGTHNRFLKDILTAMRTIDDGKLPWTEKTKVRGSQDMCHKSK